MQSLNQQKPVIVMMMHKNKRDSSFIQYCMFIVIEHFHYRKIIEKWRNEVIKRNVGFFFIYVCILKYWVLDLKKE